MVKVGEVECKWYVVDVIDVFLGCLLVVVVFVLCGKNKLIFILYVDIGDFVIVINVDKVKLIGKKVIDKIYYCYLMYFGGLKLVIVGELCDKNFCCFIEIFVKGMLFKNILGCK